MNRGRIPIRSAFVATCCSCYLLAGNAADEKTTSTKKSQDKVLGTNNYKSDAPPAAATKPKGSVDGAVKFHSGHIEQRSKEKTEMPQAISVCEQKTHLCNSY